MVSELHLWQAKSLVHQVCHKSIGRNEDHPVPLRGDPNIRNISDRVPSSQVGEAQRIEIIFITG
jgi:hypothetical protein